MTTDVCLSLFDDVYAAVPFPFPMGARVLEIGCAEADWMTPMLAQRPDLEITGIDWRACARPGVVIQGDVLAQDFGEASFDAVVGISSIEHIGLGHYDSDPVDPDGDVACMTKVARWLKPGGLFYADVPYGRAYHVEGTRYRVYDDAALDARLLTPGGIHLLAQFWRRHEGTALSATPLYPRPGHGRSKQHLVYTAIVGLRG